MAVVFSGSGNWCDLIQLYAFQHLIDTAASTDCTKNEVQSDTSCMFHILVHVCIYSYRKIFQGITFGCIECLTMNMNTPSKVIIHRHVMSDHYRLTICVLQFACHKVIVWRRRLVNPLGWQTNSCTKISNVCLHVINKRYNHHYGIIIVDYQ